MTRLHSTTAPSKQDHTEQMAELPPTGYNAIIIDGGSLIHTMPPTPSCSTFDDYVATVFYLRLFVELKACDRLDVIWDRYFPKSIKGRTRNKRADWFGGVKFGVKFVWHLQIIVPWVESYKIPFKNVTFASMVTNSGCFDHTILLNMCCVSNR